jgi:hypothetical protein
MGTKYENKFCGKYFSPNSLLLGVTWFISMGESGTHIFQE